MTKGTKGTKGTQTKVAPEFTRAREFIARYTALGDDELDIVTVWAMGTWTFSPAAPANPATYPYLYIAAAKGSGKTVLGQDVLGSICRMLQPTVGITGPGVFRIIGTYDEESGEVINDAPTLAMDEIDATFSGAKDEALRQMLNAGYKRGATVPRAAGKTTINFPVFCPKVLMGIDNGHLPDTVLDRSIRIDLRKYDHRQLTEMGVEPFYSFDVEDEAAELQQQLSDWAKREAMVLREYRPVAIEGLSARQWEIGRSIVQLAKSIGNEARIRAALHALFTKNPERPDAKVALYRAIFDLFMETDEDRLTTVQILGALKRGEVSVPGDSGKGLAAVLSEDGIAPDYIRLRPDHSGYVDGKPIQRGYFRHRFDGPFVRYLEDDE